MRMSLPSEACLTMKWPGNPTPRIGNPSRAATSDNALDCSGEDLREASGASANFDDRVFRLQVCELHNTAEDGSISQEMLAEALLHFETENVPYGIRTRVTALKGPCPRPG